MAISKNCNYKIALIHDWLSSYSFGGAEKTLFLLDNLISKKGHNNPRIIDKIP